jgi:hypothetical protein
MPRRVLGSKVRWNFRGLQYVIREFDRRTGLPEGLDILLAKIYESYIKRRFLKKSRGGGGWRDLADSTKRARLRKGKGLARTSKVPGRIVARNKKGQFRKSNVEILRDTGTLFKALSVGAPGNLTKKIKGGVRFGIIGRGRHPEFEGTISELGLIHHKGLGKVPARPIIENPDDRTLRLMGAAVRRSMGKVIRKGSQRGRSAK